MEFSEAARTELGIQVCRSICSGHAEGRKRGARDIEKIVRCYQARDAAAAEKSTYSLLRLLETEFVGIVRDESKQKSEYFSQPMVLSNKPRDVVVGGLFTIFSVLLGAPQNPNVVRMVVEDLHAVIMDSTDTYTIFYGAECVYNLIMVANCNLGAYFDLLFDILLKMWKSQDPVLGEASQYLNCALINLCLAAKLDVRKHILELARKSNNIEFMVPWLDVLKSLNEELGLADAQVYFQLICSFADAYPDRIAQFVNITKSFATQVKALGVENVEFFALHGLLPAYACLERSQIAHAFLNTILNVPDDPQEEGEAAGGSMDQYPALVIITSVFFDLLRMDSQIPGDADEKGTHLAKIFVQILAYQNDMSAPQLRRAVEWMVALQVTSPQLCSGLIKLVTHPDRCISDGAGELLKTSLDAGSVNVWDHVDLKDLKLNHHLIELLYQIALRLVKDLNDLVELVCKIKEQLSEVKGMLVELLIIWKFCIGNVALPVDELTRSFSRMSWMAQVLVNRMHPAFRQSRFDDVVISSSRLDIVVEAEILVTLLERPESVYIRLDDQALIHFLFRLLPSTSSYHKVLWRRSCLPGYGSQERVFHDPQVRRDTGPPKLDARQTMQMLEDCLNTWNQWVADEPCKGASRENRKNQVTCGPSISIGAHGAASASVRLVDTINCQVNTSEGDLDDVQ